MLNKIYIFSYAMTLYLIMSYYNIFPTDAAKKVCPITTPFVRYKYNRLPMGVRIAPDIFQEQKSALMNNLEFVRFYLGNFLLITSGLFEEHLAKAGEVINRLRSAGLKCNIDKCKFAVPKVEYLGCIITREGIKPDPKNSKQLSILNALRIKTGEVVPRNGTILP